MFRHLLRFGLPLLLCSTCLWAEYGRLDPRPRVIQFSRPSVPAGTYGSAVEIDLLVEIDESGHVIYAAVQRATDPTLAAPCLQAVRHWRFAPALRNRQPTRSRFIQPLRFGTRDSACLTAASHAAKPRRRVEPQVPAELAHLTGEVMVALEVDGTGTVTQSAIADSSAPQLNALTLAAARRWTFRPALEEGRHVATTVYLPFSFTGSASPTITEALTK